MHHVPVVSQPAMLFPPFSLPSYYYYYYTLENTRNDAIIFWISACQPCDGCVGKGGAVVQVKSSTIFLYYYNT
jgi:hypothetical protein